MNEALLTQDEVNNLTKSEIVVELRSAIYDLEYYSNRNCEAEYEETEEYIELLLEQVEIG